MVADFISADYGWLRGDGCDAHVTLKPGKNQDGYFSNGDGLAQAARAMNILQQKYPNEKHVLVFDNARTHAKQAEDALSAANMPHNPKHWGIPVPAHHTNGSIIYQPNGKPCMTVWLIPHLMANNNPYTSLTIAPCTQVNSKGWHRSLESMAILLTACTSKQSVRALNVSLLQTTTVAVETFCSTWMISSMCHAS